MKPLNRWLSLGLVLTLGCLLGMLGFSLWDKVPAPLERISWSPQAQWIAPQESSYRFYARRTFSLTDSVQAAWLRISADNDFILYVNGQSVARETNVLNNALGLASRRSEVFQDINDSLEYHVIVRPNYLLANTRDWKLTTYIDLTPYLRSGENAIALEIQKGQKSPRVVVEGAVYPVADAPPISLTTGVTPWHISTLNENHQQLRWFDLDFPDQNWSEAKAIGAVEEATYSRLSQQIFDRPLKGTWITGNESLLGEVWLNRSWQIPKEHQRAFIRFAGNGEYALLINGLLVNRYGSDDTNQLHMHDVTNLLKTGDNTLAVRLAHPLELEWSNARNSSSIQKNSLDFFLDGWIETKQGNIIAPIATDSTWNALTQPVSGWTEGSGQGQSATIIGSPDPQEFQRKFEGNAYLLNYPDYLWHQSLWQLAGIVCALVCAWALGQFWLGHRDGWWHSLGAGAGLLLPANLLLIGIGILKHRYASLEPALLFAQPRSNSLISLGFLGTVLLTLLWSQREGKLRDNHHSDLDKLSRWGLCLLLGLVAFVGLNLVIAGVALSSSPSILLLCTSFAAVLVLTLLPRRTSWRLRENFQAVLQAWPTWGQWFLLFLIVSVGFGLRFYNLDFFNLDWDENISLDASRGILRTGAPEATSGIWYTRSPAYHYILALWLWLVGDTVFNARLWSVIWGTAALIVIFIFSRQVTGKVWIALVVTALLAIDPFAIWYSRNVRFYQIVQFMTIFSFWSFFKGFIDRKGRVYQYIFCAALTLTILNQELNLILIPCFLVGFLFFYRPCNLAEDWQILVSSIICVAVIVYDLAFFTIKCLTPWVALSAYTDSSLKPHLSSVTDFASVLFVGSSRIYLGYTFLFILGFIWFLRCRETKLIFIFSSVLVNLVLLTILNPAVAERYIYGIFPLVIMLAVYSAFSLLENLGRQFESTLQGLLPLSNIAFTGIGIILVFNLEIGRMLLGYQDAIVIRNSDVFDYINTQRVNGDIVISNTPGFALSILKNLDYHFSGNEQIDFGNLYLKDGRLIDRGAGSILISNVDQMTSILGKAKRVWIHLDEYRESRSSRSELIRFFQTLGQPVMETFGARLRLWKPEDGIFNRVPNEGKDLGNY